jgi:hypothetical protein
MNISPLFCEIFLGFLFLPNGAYGKRISLAESTRPSDDIFSFKKNRVCMRVGFTEDDRIRNIICSALTCPITAFLPDLIYGTVDNASSGKENGFASVSFYFAGDEAPPDTFVCL